MSRALLIGELRGLLDIASDDELAAFAVIARKVMGRGREQYGATNLATDVRDFVKEAADEFVDAAWYLALDIVQRTAHKFAPPSDPNNEFASAGGGATNTADNCCDDCGAPPQLPHTNMCPWRVIVPGKGE